MLLTFSGTTVISVRHRCKVAIAADGQVSLNNVVVKQGAKKIRKLFDGKVLAGFAGSAADAIALFTRFESKLEEFRGNLERASVELVKDWRMDKALRRLESLLIIADKDQSFLLSGTGDLIEPDDGLLAIGSGGAYALSAAKALLAHSNLSAKEITMEALKIASSIDIYTNQNIFCEEL